ncbi:hypothetical protein L7F22_052414 [Adiantum nelumboides]|nr:hypothetical protein [Adiantum nelumboides]
MAAVVCAIILVAILFFSSCPCIAAFELRSRRGLNLQEPLTSAHTKREDSANELGLIKRHAASLRLLPRADAVPRNATRAERVAALAQHDAKRIQALNARILKVQYNISIEVQQENNGWSSPSLMESNSNIEFGVSAWPGLYMMEVTIGSPAQTFAMIMDTGSDLMWVQCAAGQPSSADDQQDSTTTYMPALSSTYATLPCSHAACQSLPGQCLPDSSCRYTYGYTSQATTEGQLASDTLTLLSTDATTATAFPGLAFGCGYNNQGEYGGASGIVGMGPGALSLPSQLSQALGGRKFSYCLLPQSSSMYWGEGSAQLVMGEEATDNIAADGAGAASVMGFTPMLMNSTNTPLYYIDVLGFSVNNERLNIPATTFALGPNGEGGTILDSGTTYTYIPYAAFAVLQQAFDEHMNLPRFTDFSSLPVCYTTTSEEQYSGSPPALRLHLQGLDLDLPPENYFIPVDDEGSLYCLAIVPTSAGPQIVGNMLHQHFKVLYDLDNYRIGFAAQSC